MWPYKTGDLLKRFNSYAIFYERTRKMWPLITGDRLIEVTTWTGLTVFPCRKKSLKIPKGNQNM